MHCELTWKHCVIQSSPTAEGQQLPLHRLADIRIEDGSATINREWGRRLIRVQVNVDDRDVSSFVAEAKEKINESLELPEGYVLDWGWPV